MHKRQMVRRTGMYTAEYKSTYSLSYRHEMPDRVVYFTQEAVDNAYLDNYLGHVIEVYKDGRQAGSMTQHRKVLLRSTIACGTLAKCTLEMVFEYEVDYE